jgi:hypothetical protein
MRDSYAVPSVRGDLLARRTDVVPELAASSR